MGVEKVTKVAAAPGPGPALQISELRRAFGGVPAVDGISLSIGSGEVVGLIGPNGSGKSTTINLISGELRPDSGSVFLFGTEVSGRPPFIVARHGLTRTFQIPRVWGRMSVGENLLVAGTKLADEALWRSVFGRRRAKAVREHINARMLEVLGQIGLTDLVNDRAETLSGGQKRLLEFGRIMMSSAKVVLLDEPFAGVNPVLRKNLAAAIAGLRRTGCAVILVEHNLQAVEQNCDRVVVMATGRVIAEGPLSAVRESREVISAYLGSSA